MAALLVALSIISKILDHQISEYHTFESCEGSLRSWRVRLRRKPSAMGLTRTDIIAQLGFIAVSSRTKS